MKNPRLSWLVGLMLLLLALRLLDLLHQPALPEVAPAVVRSAIVAPIAKIEADSRVAQVLAIPFESGDAFAARGDDQAQLPAFEPTAAVVRPAPKLRPFIGPIEPPPPLPPAPPPPPPFQIIGTWEDPQGPAVFVAGAGGTRMARVHDVVYADYEVLQVTRTQLTVRQLSSGQNHELPVPQTPYRVR